MIKSKNLINIEIDNFDVIIIDESHFFDDLIDFVNNCLDKNKYVIVAGLIADYKGCKFGKTLDLIPICSNIERLHAYCSECAKNKKCSIAIYSKKIIKSRKSIDIGGSEKYIPVCRYHYNQIEISNNKNKIEIEQTKTNKNKNINKTEEINLEINN